jgi:hypothetical protein
MLNKTTISAVLLTLSLATTGASYGEEVTLEGYIDNMLAQSIAGVKQELNHNTQAAVFTAANQSSLVVEQTYATKSSITDVNSHMAETATHDTE